jgi:ATP-dependent helicase/nuclease subunit A
MFEQMSDALVLPDQEAQQSAAATFDRNIVVTASAGTGKTTLLIERLTHLLMKSPDPVSLPEIIALTFMEKAANEIKARLRARLTALMSFPDFRERTERALQEIEQSQIGTIHSFAAHLIRLYPIEAGVDPHFETDDGQGFQQHFSQEWRDWLALELGAQGQRHDLWRAVLQRTCLEDLRQFAQRLANDLIPLARLSAQLEDSAFSPAIRTWLERKQARVRALLGRANGKKERRVEEMLAAAEVIFQSMLSKGVIAVADLDQDAVALLHNQKAGSKPPADWSEGNFEEAVALIETAKALLTIDQEYCRSLLALLTPFADRCRRSFLEAGRVTFDGLLVRARDLLKNHPQIRKQLKARYQAILVDEFQDTDPVQYEILLFLAEQPDKSAASWRDIELAPGKLFVVGDPKQSVFAFRRADIEACQIVTGQILNQGGQALTLTSSFRSHPSILAVINGLFAQLIHEQEGLQPSYQILEALAERNTGVERPGVELRLIGENGDAGKAEDLTAERAARSEAEALAAWLKTEIIGKERLLELDGRHRSVEPGDVAVLFRTFTQSREYVEALRRHGIPYVAEGEKHFYRRQEVVDFVNVLRCIRNPDDAVARLGLLRSPLGALTDREIVDLSALGAWDYRAERHPNLSQHAKAQHLERLYRVLESLHVDCPKAPLSEAIDLIFERLPILELAAASTNGEQAVANLWKLRAMAEDVTADPQVSFGGFAELLSDRVADPPDESESGLAEESSEAVRVMSIHKAKGLEFPIVALVGLQSGTVAEQRAIDLHHDWSSDVVGLRLGSVSTLEAVFVAEKLQRRRAAERRRLLYVGMTRARERLLLSGALTRRPGHGNLLALVKEGIGDIVGRPDTTMLPVGQGMITQSILPPKDDIVFSKKRKEQTPAPARDGAAYPARWQARLDRYTLWNMSPWMLTPTTLMQSASKDFLRTDRGPLDAHRALRLGILAHQALELCAYDDDHQLLVDVMERVIGRSIADEASEPDGEALHAELLDLLKTFAASEAYAELRGARILGREIPFLMPFSLPSPGEPVALPNATGHREGEGEGNIRLMEGRIDLLYEKDGALWVADYKTDRVTESELSDRAETYREQAEIYQRAVRTALGREPAGFKLIFVRVGKAVTVSC